MRRILLAVILAALLASAALLVAPVRERVGALVRPEPPAPITPLAVSEPIPVTSTSRPSATATTTATAVVTATALPSPTEDMSATAVTEMPERVTVTSTPTTAPTATTVPTPSRVEVNGRVYDAYIPSATKPQQFFQYTCEFDAAWVILKTYGIDVTGEELISRIDHDRSIEPYIKETKQGFIIYGGDIENAYSGDYKKNFLARSTGNAMRKVFTHYGLDSQPVTDRSGVEAALRRGHLVWMKTTVDFKPWRPATWVMPDGRTYKTVLGNDHAVVVMGYNQNGVVIRDVLGPTSSNKQRPYEYEVNWTTFMASWEAQSFDGLAVAPPAGG